MRLKLERKGLMAAPLHRRARCQICRDEIKVGKKRVNGCSSSSPCQELNIGGSLVTSALEEACGTNRSKIREMYNDIGDLGMFYDVFLRFCDASLLALQNINSKALLIRVKIYEETTIRELSEDIGITSAGFLA
ncbi:hypothetical protein COLO4_37657 [Corchorus olitorius]|uniref:Uncharacterized protein n=1 Tax=Corchorus olitorius TaxID=93759 RepID=A0A1R3G075_9ROSI|nr:hypothetical protein COLO4_37657 [Corchorus olitorius]